jgi:hypothetical protein
MRSQLDQEAKEDFGEEPTVAALRPSRGLGGRQWKFGVVTDQAIFVRTNFLVIAFS